LVHTISPSITLSLFRSEHKTYFFRKISSATLVLSLSVGLILWLDRSPDLFAHRLYILVLFFRFSYSYTCGRPSWPAFWSTL